MGGGDGSATVCRDQMLSAGRRAHCRVDCRLTKGGKMMRRGGDPRTRMRCGFAGRDGARNGLHGRGSRECSPRARQPFEKLRKQLRRQAQSAPRMTHVDLSRIISAPACLCRGSRSTAGSCGVCFHPACQNRTSARSGLGQRTFQPRRASDLFTSQHDLRHIPFSRPRPNMPWQLSTAHLPRTIMPSVPLFSETATTTTATSPRTISVHEPSARTA